MICIWSTTLPDATATPSSLDPVKSRTVDPSGGGLSSEVVLEKRPLNGCNVVVVVSAMVGRPIPGSC